MSYLLLFTFYTTIRTYDTVNSIIISRSSISIDH